MTGWLIKWSLTDRKVGGCRAWCVSKPIVAVSSLGGDDNTGYGSCRSQHIRPHYSSVVVNIINNN